MRHCWLVENVEPSTGTIKSVTYSCMNEGCQTTRRDEKDTAGNWIKTYSGSSEKLPCAGTIYRGTQPQEHLDEQERSRS